MEQIASVIDTLNGEILWGPPMLLALAFTGMYLMIRLGGMPILKLGPAFRELWRGRKPHGGGDISPFNALMTSLSATIGTGNIAGVATAVFAGGPGALFWMWCIALIGMATKYAEAVCAVHYREKDDKGLFVGGPMYYIRNGMGPKWQWLAIAFAVFGMLAGFGIGNTVQSNSVAKSLTTFIEIPELAVGVALMILIGLVLVGGIKRLAEVVGKLVPIMAFCYVAAALFILISHITEVPGALLFIIEEAFKPTAAAGGFAGATVWAAIRFGVARGVFSNEAGLGSAPIAHAAAQTDSPVRQGTIAMLGTFIDTIIICTMTGLVIVITGTWTSGESGAALSTLAFNQALPGVGQYIVAFGLVTFAFTSILGWSYYSERCAEFLFGTRAIVPFRILWVLAIPMGTQLSLDFVWKLADMLNALMAIPNLIALVALSPVVIGLTKKYYASNPGTSN